MFDNTCTLGLRHMDFKMMLGSVVSKMSHKMEL